MSVNEPFLTPAPKRGDPEGNPDSQLLGGCCPLTPRDVFPEVLQWDWHRSKEARRGVAP